MTLDKNSLFSLIYLSGPKKFQKFSRPSLAYLQYKSFRLNLLNGEREDIGAVDFLSDMENERVLEKSSAPKVRHLFYEFGHICAEMDELVSERSPLAVIIQYERSELIDFNFEETQQLSFEPVEYPRFESYLPKFNAGMEKLLEGECYQFNLTSPFVFKSKEPLELETVLKNAFRNKDMLGAYAHYTHLGPLGRGLLSNSPECLFQANLEKKKIYSMPIKGTYKLSEGEDHESGFSRLKKSKKDQGELYMITDLVRNDLTAIDMRPARIMAKKRRLDVPGLSHQYSIVETDLSDNTNLSYVLKALFPGGSITGAPKKRVMKILKELEGHERGLYCGSTLISHRDLMAASINIRSAEIDYSVSEIKYCAGGGVTLNSEAKGEFEESYAKMESFLQLFSYQ